MSQPVHDILNGAPHPDAPLGVGRLLEWLRNSLRRWFSVRGRIDRSEGYGGVPDAGKPAPIAPSPTHHLVAARELPPRSGTHILPFD